MNLLRSAARSGGPSSRNVLIGATLALCVTANPIFIIFYGLVGIQGSPLITAGFLVACEMALLYWTFRPARLHSTDYLFCAFLLCAVLSFVINGRTASTRDTVLFLIAIAAYPSLRGLSFAQPPVQKSFVLVSGAIVAVGTVLTAHAMVTQWGGPYVRPFVLGVNDAAATFFLMACGFLMVSVIATGLDQRKSLLLSAFVFLPGVVFSASYVRATFFAIIVTLVFALVLSESKQRRHFAVVIGVFLTAIALGLAPRHLLTSGSAKAEVPTEAASPTATATLSETITPTEAATRTETVTGTETVAPSKWEPAYPGRAKAEVSAKMVRSLGSPPSCTANLNMGDSTAVRKALLQDALWYLPAVGPFGLGLGNFPSMSCMNLEVHNSYLQALIEFGWVGGICFCAALLITLYRLLPHYQRSDDVRFAVCGLAYVGMLSVVHGILSEDRLLFAMLGLAAGVCEMVPRSTSKPES